MRTGKEIIRALKIRHAALAIEKAQRQAKEKN